MENKNEMDELIELASNIKIEAKKQADLEAEIEKSRTREMELREKLHSITVRGLAVKVVASNDDSEDITNEAAKTTAPAKDPRWRDGRPVEMEEEPEEDPRLGSLTTLQRKVYDFLSTHKVPPSVISKELGMLSSSVDYILQHGLRGMVKSERKLCRTVDGKKIMANVWEAIPRPNKKTAITKSHLNGAAAHG